SWELRSEFRRYGLRTGPVLAHLVKTDQLEPGRWIISRRRARPVDRVDCFRPLLLSYVCVREAKKNANLIGVFGKQIVIEISRLVRATRCRVNLREIACGGGEVRVDRQGCAECALCSGIILLSGADSPE